MTVKVVVGKTIALEVVYQDQNGNPMLSPVAPDAAPAWSNANPAGATLAAAADGLTCVATTVAPGVDTVGLSLNVGGQAFSASLAVEVDAPPQVLSSIAIKATVNP